MNANGQFAAARNNMLPDPPPPPPTRKMRDSLFGGLRETKESIRATEDWRKYMEGWSAGFEAGKRAGAFA